MSFVSTHEPVTLISKANLAALLQQRCPCCCTYKYICSHGHYLQCLHLQQCSSTASSHSSSSAGMQVRHEHVSPPLSLQHSHSMTSGALSSMPHLSHRLYRLSTSFGVPLCECNALMNCDASRSTGLLQSLSKTVWYAFLVEWKVFALRLV